MAIIHTDEPYSDTTVKKLTEILIRNCGDTDNFNIIVSSSWTKTCPCITIVCSNEYVVVNSLNEFRNNK